MQMSSNAARLTGRTVRPNLTLVNSLVSVDRQERAEGERDAPGARLERYIRARWTRREGGIRMLATQIGSSTETIYSWFRGDAEPSMAHLRALADALGVRRSVLVAVFDGDPLPGESLDADQVESRLRAVEAGLALLARQAGAALPEPGAPRATTGSGGHR